MKPAEIQLIANLLEDYTQASEDLVRHILPLITTLQPLLDALVLTVAESQAKAVRHLVEEYEFSREEALALVSSNAVAMTKALRDRVSQK